MTEGLSVTETTEILKEVRAAAARLKEALARLETETRQRRDALQRHAAREQEEARKNHAALLETLTTEHQAQLAALEQRRAARETRIQRADIASRKTALQKIDENEGRRKFRSQKGLLDVERGRDARLAELDENFKTFHAETEQERFALETVRARARQALGAYRSLRHALGTNAEGTPPRTLGEVAALRSRAEAGLKRINFLVLPLLFRFLPIWLWWLAGVGLMLAGAGRLGLSISEGQFRNILAAVIGGATVLYTLGWVLARIPAKELAASLSLAERGLEQTRQLGETKYHEDREETTSQAGQQVAELQHEWLAAQSEASQARNNLERDATARHRHAIERNERLHSAKRQQSEEHFRSAMQNAEAELTSLLSRRSAVLEEHVNQLEAEFQMKHRELEDEWNTLLNRANEHFKAAQEEAERHFRPWEEALPYTPAQSALNLVKFGQTRLEVTDPFKRAPLAVSAPLFLVLPRETSILVETTEPAARQTAIDALNNIIYRVLQTTPPGKAAFTLIDPVHLGQSFSAVMHLADFEENIVNRRIWTEPGEIEERLSELNAHMEKVIQMYLRNEFSDIVEYNQAAGSTAEKFHFLVVADFPANFSDVAMRRLMKIAASGARCGVFTLIHWDKRQPFLPGWEVKELLETAVHFHAGPSILLPKLGTDGVTIQLDSPPPPEIATPFLHAVGEASRGSNTVQVPFSQVTPVAEKRWSADYTEELRVPIGRSGANKLQYFALGKGTKQHVLIAGKTGSGKSTLFHVLVTNLALWASPNQVEFYLVDFKKGVEFKDYAVAKLPHARVIAIESDREFGLSVLRRVDEELRIRGEKFRAQGAQDLAGYKRTSGEEMPRVLLIIDEFQELFVQDDSISQNAALLLDRIVRQGRAFGIHVVLGSQTLGGAYSLARATLGQMAVRIALQSNEADAYLIMDESNPAPRLLSRPGEGIYNDSGGMLEANSPFQVVWLPERERRERLRDVQALAEQQKLAATPVVFEGNTLADLGDNADLYASIGSGGAVAWLGLPNEIKGPTHTILDERLGRNLLVAGQHDDHVRATLTAVILSLAAQNDPRSVRFILFDVAAAPLALPSLPHEIIQPKPAEIPEMLRTLAREIEGKEGTAHARRVFLVVHNLAAFKVLRPEDEFSISLEGDKPNPAADFQRIYNEGPTLGMHVIAHVDGFNNANRFLGRKGLKEFAARVLFQMSASDSASFADDPRAGTLGLNRGLLYDEQEGTYEIFRPYSRPGTVWMNGFAEELRARFAKQQSAPVEGTLPGR